MNTPGIREPHSRNTTIGNEKNNEAEEQKQGFEHRPNHKLIIS